MAANVGEVSIALMLDEAGFTVGLEAARAALEGFEGELSGLTIPPELLNLEGAAQGLGADETFAQAGASAGTAFDAGASGAILAGAGAAATSADGVAESAASALDAASGRAGAPGAELAGAFASGIGSGAATAAAEASGMAGSAASAAAEGMAGASGAGQSFAAGLAEGIRAGRSGVVSAAAEVARAAAEAARSALSIHSPSRVTRELGEFFDLGFIRGVRDMTPEVERAVRAAVWVEPPAPAAPSAATIVSAARQSAAPALDCDALAEAMERRRMVLTLDGRRVAELQRRESARARSLHSRSVALGYGK